MLMSGSPRNGGVTGDSPRARSSIHHDDPLRHGFLITFISRMLISDRYLSIEYALATTLFMQYVILRVALHEVLIVIALGHVEANVKSFGKKNLKKRF